MDCLKIKKVMCKVADEDRSCDYCNSEMVHVGWKFVREEIEIVPAEVYRVQYYQETVACPNCKEFAPYFKQAPIPSPLIRGSYASHSAVAYIMYQKYYLYIPLYRQEKDWAEHGVILGRTTMANWIIRLAFELLKPIFDLMHQRMIERDILYADETPCQVLKEDGRTPQQKSYMWVYIAMEDDLPTIILYDYEPGRSGDYPGEFLKGFDGYCHCDGYSGYNKIANLVHIGCFAHCRRYFFEAIPAKKSSKVKSGAEIGYDYCNSLFIMEKQMAEAHLTPEQRKARRLEVEKPILDNFWNWVEKQNPIGGSRFDKAITYARNQKENLMNFLKDGRCEISNNAAERRVKSYVMGRKNFLFHDTTKGADASAIIYSLIESAKANGLNVYKYLDTVLLYMPDYKNEPEGIERMLPWSDFMKETCGEP